jgi:hypothetical protein
LCLGLNSGIHARSRLEIGINGGLEDAAPSMRTNR